MSSPRPPNRKLGFKVAQAGLGSTSKIRQVDGGRRQRFAWTTGMLLLRIWCFSDRPALTGAPHIRPMNKRPRGILESLLAWPMRGIWRAAATRKNSKGKFEWLGPYIFLGIGIFGIYNLYTLLFQGTVFVAVRRGQAGWIKFDAAHSFEFVCFSIVYIVIGLISVLLICSPIMRRHQARRDTLKVFTEGLGPAPIKRDSNER